MFEYVFFAYNSTYSTSFHLFWYIGNPYYNFFSGRMIIKKIFVFLGFFASASCTLEPEFDELFQGHLKSEREIKDFIKNSLPRSQPPESWEWNNVNDTNFLTLVSNF